MCPRTRLIPTDHGMARKVRRGVDGTEVQGSGTSRRVIIGKWVVRQGQTFRAAEFFRLNSLGCIHPSFSAGPASHVVCQAGISTILRSRFDSRGAPKFKLARKWDAVVPNPGRPLDPAES